MEVKNLPESLRKSADYLRGLSPIDFSCEWVTCHRAADEIERLQAIVDALTLTEDGVRVYQGMRLYKLMPDKNEIFIILANPGYINCFSTREAAEAARETK